MPSFADLERAWLLRMLGLSSSTLSESDLAAQLYKRSSVVYPAPKVPAGNYFYVEHNLGMSTGTATNTVITTFPWVLGFESMFDRIGAEVVTAGNAGSVIRLAVYADDGAGKPGALIIDAGTIDAATTGVKEITTSFSLTPGTYWLSAVAQNAATTAPVWRTTINHATDTYIYGTAIPAAGVQHAGYTGVTAGAMPSTFPLGSGFASVIPRIFVRTA